MSRFSILKLILITIFFFQGALTLASTHTQRTKALPVEREAPAEEKKGLGYYLKRLFSGSRKTKSSGPQSPGSIAKVTKSSDVTVKHFIDARYLDSQFKSGKLSGQGQHIIDIAKQNGIDPVFFASIIILESGHGGSKRLRDQNNPAGLTTTVKDKRGRKKTVYASFDSVEEGLQEVAFRLKTKYIDKDKRTIAAIAKIYAPPGAHNDTGTNRKWPSDVSDIMNRLVTGSTQTQSRI